MDTIHGCPLCSRPRTTADARGLAWSSHHGPHGVVFVCGPCTRTHLFDLETGLLDPARTDRTGPGRLQRAA
ncbi:hypothetical protein Ae168Ps1_0954 [Pseudonocardia sp. Ae168_Ps1]|uniref:hypothetical protein n=1 Tax=unclassified Pseudonocardia TaxID=2619320 RepID=UPI0006CB3CF0|nr:MULTISPECIES: hypothetical protein [unclassified Pseudonocardia]ALE73206.1 hypothetical protein FRP1_09110 [Pseudonocardia sp. EC080625-04]ALL76539.1 hypothetical protein AD006_16675 [Pseudonocardia sp. EC080610-09]ALL83565.1 hypothetical protein AD017_24510 [Pseudonocardia sp. EC080619-01]OLL72576.1 hypothetical protein Ae150APs1_0954 [Pseudonocardia sp. Ae150A_Ps1]OLL78548.1 hypothetical protein Ae168Ps1_0954 [Pseudonocardia sp. Ae168_Ps1]